MKKMHSLEKTQSNFIIYKISFLVNGILFINKIKSPPYREELGGFYGFVIKG